MATISRLFRLPAGLSASEMIEARLQTSTCISWVPGTQSPMNGIDRRMMGTVNWVLAHDNGKTMFSNHSRISPIVGSIEPL